MVTTLYEQISQKWSLGTPERQATLNTNTTTSGWYTRDVALSTLLFLAGPKDCLEDSIPELGRFKFQLCVVRKPMSAAKT